MFNLGWGHNTAPQPYSAARSPCLLWGKCGGTPVVGSGGSGWGGSGGGGSSGGGRIHRIYTTDGSFGSGFPACASQCSTRHPCGFSSRKWIWLRRTGCPCSLFRCSTQWIRRGSRGSGGCCFAHLDDRSPQCH